MTPDTKCLHQNTSPGDLFPPTCIQPHGHPGPHKTRNQLGKPPTETWPNNDDEEEAAA